MLLGEAVRDGVSMVILEIPKEWRSEPCTERMTLTEAIIENLAHTKNNSDFVKVIKKVMMDE